VGDVEVKMINKMNCPVCKKEVFSSVGNGCKMCGMALDNVESFCCKICMRKYNTINRYKRESMISHSNKDILLKGRGE